MLDVNRCPVGTDDAATPGTEVFARRTGERYTVYTVTGPLYAMGKDEKGNSVQILDENGKPIEITEETVVDGKKSYKLYVYNEENEKDVDTQYTIQNLEVNQKLLENYSYLPVHGNPASGKTGEYDVDVYKSMLAGWREKSIVLDPNAQAEYGADEYYDSFVVALGTQGSIWKDMVESQTKLTENVEDKRQQVAGVSTEEEMVSLLMYQHAYNASSRYITVIDEMLEHLIERLG